METNNLSKEINKNLSEIIFSKSDLDSKRPALFFDRDGVLIKECHYIRDANQVEIERGAKRLLRFAFDRGWLVVVVSNQSGISRKIISWDNYFKVTKKMISLFGEPNPLSAIYANSEGPDSKKNYWRKPSPEMILRSVRLLNIDLSKSFMIGDRLTDIKSGLNAGIRFLVHTKTGYGEKEDKTINEFINSKMIPKGSKLIEIENLTEFPYEYLYKINKNKV